MPGGRRVQLGRMPAECSSLRLLITINRTGNEITVKAGSSMLTQTFLLHPVKDIFSFKTGGVCDSVAETQPHVS